MPDVSATEETISHKSRDAQVLQTNPILALASWCECLQGKQPLRAGLRQLSKALGARSVCLSRHSRELVRVAQVLTFEEPEITASFANVDRSFAHCVLGVHIDHPRVGSVWLSSTVEEWTDPALLEFQDKRNIAETVVIPLASEGKRVDYLELHFAQPLTDTVVALLGSFGDALSRTWATRNPGLFAEAILVDGGKHQVSSAQGDLLSPANPFGLTRCEFRICALLKQGIGAETICDQLMISPATLRSHYRRIYKKTHTRSPTELAFAILAPPRLSIDQLSHRSLQAA
ncbi:helix-turn-helix transcriptional regulator [Rubellimicrobium roseum]|uniref:Helix-turn-helix transcriptional regulator n=1 Tax=Rubellimicrobium roseum TaxID=687525 RepID=A0A5C4N7N5_9RHOB|nr:helix-turn-helix transcriptional regulator [Rubellimicrobium roseum]TNC59036.1 helix-turn-helix transcriptional regulator [Rubellimicrobium roseum]